MQASRSLHSHQPRAWLRHTPYLRATQTLRLRCRGVCGTHARGFCCYQMIPNHAVIQSAANAAWVMYQQNSISKAV